MKTSFAIKYEHLDKTLTVSDLSHFSEPDEAFAAFVEEMSDAFEVMRDLRQISETAVSEVKKAEVFELLYQVVAVTKTCYRPNAAYTIECVQVRDAALKTPNLEHTPDVVPKIAMAECLGSSVYELRSPITSLLGHMELIQKYFPSGDERQECLVIIDKIIMDILKRLALYRILLSRGTNLQDLKPEEFQELLG